MSWYNPLSWLGGASLWQAKAPTSGPAALPPGHGVLDWLRAIGAAWTGPSTAERNRATADLSAEKVRVNAGAVSGRMWFLPYLDQTTGETAKVRAAYRLMLADPSVKSALYSKVLAVAGLDLQVHPGAETERGLKKAEYIRHLLTRVEGGLPGLVQTVCAPTLIDGYCVAEEVWGVETRGPWKGSLILKALKGKDPEQLMLEIDQFRNVTGLIGLQYNAGLRFDTSNFVMTRYLPLYSSPTGMSDLRAAYRAYWLIDTAWKLRSIHLEKYTSPLLKGTYTNPNQRLELAAELERAKSGTWMTLPVDAQVEALDLSVKGTGDFESAIKDLRHEVYLGITGAILQALEGTATGARSIGEVHQSSAQQLVWYLSVLFCEAINRQVIPDAIDLNFADDEDYPSITLGGINDTEMANSLVIDQGLMGMGLPLSRKELYKRYGRSEPIDERDAVSGFAKVPAEAKPSVSAMAEEDRYSHIDFSPPEGVREAAARGLELRQQHGHGGTEVGVARARDLSNGRRVSPDTARRMASYFARHEVDKQADGWGEDSPGYVAWLLWGGDPGQAWASKLVRQMEAADRDA